MALVETPGLLIGGEEKHYYDKFKEIYEVNNKIILPENNKEILVYTQNDISIFHIWRGGGYEGCHENDFDFNDPKYWRRAQRIGWIKYIIENPHVRRNFKDTKNHTICLVSGELEYTVVLQAIKDTHFRLVTGFHTFRPTRYYTDKRFAELKF